MSSKEKEKEKEKTIGLARPLAPEDIVPGLYVVALTEVTEIRFRSSRCSSEPWEEKIGYLRMESAPCPVEAPSKVLAVCLPFVVLRSANGGRRTIDVRTMRLAQVSKQFVKALKQPGRAEL